MARESIDDLGELQKAVMESVWELGEGTVQQVRDRLDREPQPAYTTVLSVMQKLEKAGWLSHRPEGRSYVYLPTRSRDEAGSSTLRTFIDRAFRGDPMLLFQRLLDDKQLSENDLSEIKRMIDQKRRKEGRHV
ncbi:MAG: BlaI/MecI/CopY family transcriptional regulator [Paludisphaera borealis]|uniref:BlaI/MecI/CopY family transcriptional regulator n=1 Tax=Paludisphaera borealis TaxID=1387353 RepID=UPI0028420BA6|nr:BlaI/MecI/CopY family transcriptional regulator [Paludisphaera borealis]MDR3620021.1 BlaI/MecI/CopY family transcriptional regulator [Paludisphaera borealis]